MNSKQYLAKVKSQLANAESNVEYYKSLANERVSAYEFERLKRENAMKDAQIASLNAEITRLDNRVDVFLGAKANEDARFQNLFNSALRTAIATKPDVRT